MADISLRGYLKEIDELIERDQLDEAISHCRHILQVYPKHLDTYRLLGKSYLEAKRFGDAADIFQRVLSAVPDDFVSHIGMAIVREDEGNIDSAIWHMERAFETNPANPAIRQELSRLIGRRDGIEPHKIRLTRGALARQYAQGELYPQAIAELRSALQEDPNRPELEVLLAKMYWRAGQPKQARNISAQILEKLPFSYEANRIMAALFESEGKTDKAGEHHRRLAALEPYAAFSDSSSIDPVSVDANAIRIDHYAWIPGQPLPTAEPSQPDWVTSLGVDLTADETTDEGVDESPPWLTEIERGAPAQPGAGPALMDAAAPQAASEEPSSEDEIPAWMKEAGWGPSTGEAEEAPVSFSESELEALEAGVTPEETSEDEGELAPAEIPNWLQDKAPRPGQEAVEQTVEPQPVEEPEGMMPDWLSEIADEAEVVSPDPREDVAGAEEERQVEEVIRATDKEEPRAAEGAEVPSWIDDLSPGATSTIISWLGDRPEAQQTPEKGAESAEPEQVAPEPVAAEESGEDVPSWLGDIAEGEETPDLEASPTEPSAAPSWLAGVAQAASEQASSARPPTPPDLSESAPSEPEEDWLDNLRAADAQAEPIEEEAAEAPDWLEGVAEPGAPTDEAEEPGTPDWLRGVREPEEAEAEIPAAPEAAEAPDWLKTGDELEPEPTTKAEVPDWLQGIADQGPSLDQVAEEAAAIESPASEDRQASPDWLKDFAGEGEAEVGIDAQAIQEIEAELSAATEPATFVEEAAPGGIGVEDELDDEEVFRWLESLADRQEGEAVAPSGRPPSARATESDQVVPSMRQVAPPEEPEASLEWLEDLAAERGLDVDVTPGLAPAAATPEPAAPQAPEALEAEEEESPDWLREMAMAPSEETMISIPKPPITEADKAALDETEGSAPTVQPPQEPVEIPSWLDEAASMAADVPAEPAEKPELAAEPPARPAPPPTQPPQPTAEKPKAKEAEKAVAAPVEPAPEAEAAPPVAEVKAPAAKTEKPKHYKEPPTEAEILLQGARQALAAGDAGRALSDYKKMINRKQELDTVIEDLEEALDRYPNLPTMWQALGDAYMKADRLAEAIQAYQRGMEVA
jgi:tetratricopeptide (TPR) repeat protein